MRRVLKYLNEAFRADVGRAIARIESQSHAEVVVVVKEHVNSYMQYPLGIGAICAFVALTYFRFAPDFFDEWIIYAGTIVAFVLGAAITAGLPGILRLLVGKNRLAKATEIMARAYFQKGGIHHTRDKTGVLIFVALFERQVAVIADRGVEMAIPPKEWEKIRRDLNAIFQTPNPASALLDKLAGLQAVFSQYVPQVADDTNELPDNLEITL
jgi:putative membrane protein